jgi:hypothetical protein
MIANLTEAVNPWSMSNLLQFDSCSVQRLQFIGLLCQVTLHCPALVLANAGSETHHQD